MPHDQLDHKFSIILKPMKKNRIVDFTSFELLYHLLIKSHLSSFPSPTHFCFPQNGHQKTLKRIVLPYLKLSQYFFMAESYIFKMQSFKIFGISPFWSIIQCYQVRWWRALCQVPYWWDIGRTQHNTWSVPFPRPKFT